MVIISKHLVLRGCIGLTVFSFIFLKYYSLKTTAVLINNVKIHWRQQFEL